MASINFGTTTVSARSPWNLAVPLIFFAGGLVIFFVSLNMMVQAWNFGRYGVPISGRVTEITQERVKNSDGGYEIRAFEVIEFTSVRGNKVKLRESYSGNAVGQEVQGTFLPGQPENITVTSVRSQWIFAFIALLMAGVFASLGAWLGISMLKRQAEIKWLLERGSRVRATITGANHQRSHHHESDGRSHTSESWSITCRWTEPRTGKKYVFESESVQHDPGDLAGSEIDVYIDPANPDRHYVDAETAGASGADE